MNTIHVLGLGAIGSNLIVQLVQKYPKFSFTGIDYDKVEERNIATQQYLLPHVGMKKVDAISIILGMKNRTTTFFPRHKKISTDQDLSELVPTPHPVLLIDCFDNSESRQIVQNAYPNISGSVIHIGFSPQYSAEIIWGENYTVPNNIPQDQNDICQMSEAVPFINFVVSVACMNISNFLESNVKKDIIITNKMVIRYLN
jgi:hypothetical protein